jgi:peptidoglycan hydrolase-like protein with peptidoglycan-binding domain
LVFKTILVLGAACAMVSAATTATKRKAVKHASHPAVTASSNAKGKRVVRRSTRSYQQAPTPQRYKEIQEALAGKGYFQGEPNGTWGPDSVEGLKRFQADQNLMPDGKIGSLSLIALGLGPKRLSAQSNAPSQPDTPK